MAGASAALAKGAKLTDVLTPGGSNALQQAAFRGSAQVLEFLIKEGAEVNAVRSRGSGSLS